MVDHEKGHTALHKAAAYKRRTICCMLGNNHRHTCTCTLYTDTRFARCHNDFDAGKSITRPLAAVGPNGTRFARCHFRAQKSLNAM
jgi:hypothetical protein